jgi:hypothetical protein
VTLANDGTTPLYLARKHDCHDCTLKAQCCPKAPFRRIPRNQHEAAREITRSFTDTEAFEQSRRERTKIEMPFAHLKRILRLGRLRLRAARERPRRAFARRNRPGGSHRWSRARHPSGFVHRRVPEESKGR